LLLPPRSTVAINQRCFDLFKARKKANSVHHLPRYQLGVLKRGCSVQHCVMRALLLLRAAANAAAAVEPFGWLATGACGPLGALQRPIVLTSLVGLQLQQQAGYAAARLHGDEEDDTTAAQSSGRHSKLSHSQRRQLIERKLQQGDEAVGAVTQSADELAALEPRQRIDALLQQMGRPGDDSASQFVSRCVVFGPCSACCAFRKGCHAFQCILPICTHPAASLDSQKPHNQ
jgi:hypothetical protein